MQQTTNYKLNLIEKTDTFSPDPLNENMEKVEGALTQLGNANEAETAARAAVIAELDQRLKAFEVHHVAMGRYSFNRFSAQAYDADLGFTPKVVLFFTVGQYFECAALVDPEGSSEFASQYAQIVPGGFHVAGNSTTNPFNQTYRSYIYLALA